jgi:hypothetical protein
LGIVLVYTQPIGWHARKIIATRNPSRPPRRTAVALGPIPATPDRHIRLIFKLIHPGGKSVTPIADVAAKPNVRDAPPPRLRVHPGGRDTQESRDLFGGEEVAILGDRLSSGFGHLMVSDREQAKTANEFANRRLSSPE